MTHYPDIKSVGIKLVPFIITFTLYFVMLIPSEKASIFAAFIKCLPIISLITFILLQGFNSKKNLIFQRKISIGLLFSCFGDALLVWPNFFIHGMVAFGIGHMLYISALGFRPLKLIPGVILYLMSTVMVYILMPGLNEVSLKIGVPLYSYILATMAWRAVARISRNDSGSIEWNGLITGLGGLAWVFSDASLGYHHFHSPLPYSQVLIMISYYLGQLGITMSVLNFGSSKLE